MRIIDAWDAPLPFRRLAYRIVEVDGTARLEVSVEGEPYTPVAEGHAVARRVAELLLADRRRREQKVRSA